MKKRKQYSLLLLSGVLTVAAMIFVAMLTYPIPYSWEKLYLSSLGLTVLRDGTPNTVSALLFNGALVLAGAMSASYFCFRGNCTNRKVLIWLLRITGIIGGVGLLGIGLTPYNLSPHFHDCCTWIASGGLILAIFISVGAVKGSGTTFTENILWTMFGVFTLLIWYALQHLRQRGLLSSTPTGQLQQKFTVLFFWMYMLWNSLALYRENHKSL